MLRITAKIETKHKTTPVILDAVEYDISNVLIKKLGILVAKKASTFFAMVLKFIKFSFQRYKSKISIAYFKHNNNSFIYE